MLDNTLHKNILVRMKKKNKKTVFAFLTELDAIDNEVGPKILTALKHKDLLNSPTTSAHYSNELFELLDKSIALSATYRIMLTRFLAYITSLDKKRMQQGKEPLGLNFLMAEIGIKDEEEE